MTRENGMLCTHFPNATYWLHKDHWNWATHPNPREKASFLNENIIPIQESGQLKFIEGNQYNFAPGIELITANGHTEKQILPIIEVKGKKVAFMGDLIPSSGHIPVPYVMGYDVRPLVAMEEKAKFLKRAAEEDYFLFFEHDPVVECCSLEQTEKGVRLKQAFPLKEIF